MALEAPADLGYRTRCAVSEFLADLIDPAADADLARRLGELPFEPLVAIPWGCHLAARRTGPSAEAP